MNQCRVAEQSLNAWFTPLHHLLHATRHTPHPHHTLHTPDTGYSVDRIRHEDMTHVWNARCVCAQHQSQNVNRVAAMRRSSEGEGEGEEA